MPDEALEAWIEKAEEDYHFVLIGVRQKKYPVYNGICFNAQQCAEKYLKSFLIRHNIPFRKTHDLSNFRGFVCLWIPHLNY